MATLPELRIEDVKTLDRYERLLKMADREVRAITSLATALRLTNQSVDKRVAAREAVAPERPWK